ncbi:MAG TPA: pilus assembly PilX N-terminal domain-containing protein [Longimicrobium sp.]
MMFPNLAPARNRRGAALPVALMGLVAVSLLVTAALFTSSTEFAISAAHRTGAASLFDADAALEQYVADRLGAGLGMDTTAAGAVRGPGGAAYTVQVDRMSDSRNMDSVPMTRTEIFSLLVQPANGRGRGVGAFITAKRSANPLRTNINSGATSGGAIKISGSSVISNGSDQSNYCGAADNESDFAVQVTSDACPPGTANCIDAGEKNLDGAKGTTSYTKAELAERLLGPGVTLRSLAENAGIKFGAMWDSANYSHITRAYSTTSTPRKYNWGCPAALGVACPSTAAADLHMVVAIDASGLSDKTVVINGDYGQGIIVVLNGNLRIQGNFVFKGILLVEGDMDIKGGSGGEDAKIEGSVVAFGANSAVADNVSGNATIRYNTCGIKDAERAMNNSALDNAPQARSGGTFSWYELIR